MNLIVTDRPMWNGNNPAIHNHLSHSNIYLQIQPFLNKEILWKLQDFSIVLDWFETHWSSAN